MDASLLYGPDQVILYYDYCDTFLQLARKRKLKELPSIRIVFAETCSFGLEKGLELY